MQTIQQQIGPALHRIDEIRTAPTLQKLGKLDDALADLSRALVLMAARIDAITPYVDEGEGAG